MSEKVLCTKIGVDCVKNDPVDYRAGGPYYLGFDFYVDKNHKDEMIDFIIRTLYAFEVPLSNIYCGVDAALDEKDIWTKPRILQAVMEEAEYIKAEADRTKFHK